MLHETQADIIRVVAKSPISLACLLTQINANWVEVTTALDGLLAAGIVATAEPSPMELPTYYLNS